MWGTLGSQISDPVFEVHIRRYNGYLDMEIGAEVKAPGSARSPKGKVCY